MADPMHPPLPPGFTLDAPQAGTFGNRPVIQQGAPVPTPQTPEQKKNTLVNIQQGEESIKNQQFNQNQGLRQEFNALPQVKAYSDAIQSLGGALQAPDTPQGDLAIVYSFAKAMDPGSVVREGEMGMATATASLPQELQVQVQKLTQGQRLPPEVRLGLVETMRQRVAAMRQAYDQARGRYATVAEHNGFDPNSVLGPPLYEAYRPLEEQYIRAHGGTPRDPNAPQIIPPTGTGDARANISALNPDQTRAYQAFLSANPNPSGEQLGTFLSHLTGQQVTNADEIAKAVAQGRGVSSTVENKTAQQLADQQLQQGGQGFGNSLGAGVTDAITLGGADELAAAGAALKGAFNGQGSFGDLYDTNVQANRLTQDQLRNDNPAAFIGGQVAGSALLPTFGAGTPAELAAVGAGYGGAYGFNSGEGLGGRLTGAAEGAAAGGALGYAIPRGVQAFRRESQEVPPLVDPATGELNQPLDSMKPGQRVQAFNDAGINTVTPAMAGGRTARVIEQGFNNIPGSAGVMEDVNSAVSKEARSAMQGVAQRFGSSKTLNEGGAELQRGANERIERARGVISKAYQAIPISDKAQASTSNTVTTLQQLTGRFQSNPRLAELAEDPKIKGYLQAFEGGPVSWQDLKDFRSLIGEKIGDMRFGESSRVSDLRALYAGLSEDMRATAASQGPRAVKAFERANNLNRQNEELIQNSLTRILGKGGDMSPEKAAEAVKAMTKGGKSTGDLKTLAQIKAATVKSGAWDEIASTLIHLGGQPSGSEGRQFNPQTFIEWYADMAAPARNMLFKPEQRKALENFVAVSQQLARVKGLTNTSNTTPTMIGSGLLAAGGVAAVSHPSALLAMLGGGVANFGMAKAWANSVPFVRWATGFLRAASTGDENAVRSQIGRLQSVAATNPELRGQLVLLQQRLISAANDNALPQAVASDSSQNQQ